MGLNIDAFEPQASVLGAILLEPEKVNEAALALTEADFQHTGCRMLWSAMARLLREGKVVDPVTCKDILTGFEGAGELIVRCMELAPMAGGFHAHMEALKRQSQLMRLKELAEEMATAVDVDDARAIFDKMAKVSIANQARERRGMADMLRSFAERHADQTLPDYLPWPFKTLNEGIHMRGGKYIIIGGYPSDGKTAFALACGFKQAERRKVRFYSFETDADTVEDRALASLAGIQLESIQANSLTTEDWNKYAMAAEYSQSDFEVISAAGMTVDDIRADALASRADVIYIDYLQLIQPGSIGRNYSRFDAVTQISMDLQKLAKTTGITVVALSQMTRPAADKKGNVPEPTMHNLRESGQIEQDADVILLLYRMDQTDIRAQRKLAIAKNKEGRTGRFMLDFDGEYQRFREAKPGFSYAKNKPHQTPVLSDRSDYQQETFEDPECPF